MTTIPAWGLPLEDGDNKWARGCRLLQAHWRAFVLEMPAGAQTSDGPDRVVSSMLPISGTPVMAGFLTSEVIAAVEDRLVHPEYGGLLNEDRLRRNLLSSQPLTFNLFGQLQAHPTALLPWVRTFDKLAEAVTDVRIEWAPEKAKHFGGGSAFDAFVEYETGVGERGFLAVECKYAENLSKSDVKRVRPVYVARTIESGQWRSGAVEALDQQGLRQFWLNTLLAQSLLASDYDRGYSVVLSCAADLAAGDAVEKVRAQVVESGFLRWCSYEELLSTIDTAELSGWNERFATRYLDFGPVAEWLDPDDPRQPAPNVFVVDGPLGPAVLVSLHHDEYLAVAAPDALEGIGVRTSDAEAGLVRSAQRMLASAGMLQPVVEQLTGQTLRLTTEGQHLLRTFEKVHSNKTGAMLGIVRQGDGSGRLTGNLSFVDPRSVAGLATNLPMIAGALAMQAQLARIEKALATIEVDVDFLIRSDQWAVEAGLEADLEILGQLHDRALESGSLTDDDWDRLVAIERSVRQVNKLADKHLSSLRELLDAVDRSLSERIQGLTRVLQTDRIGPWLAVRIRSDLAMARWSFLHVVRRSVTEPASLPSMVAEAQERIRSKRRELDDLAAAVDRYLRLDSSSGLLDKVRVFSQAELRRLLLQLGDLLAAYEGELRTQRPAAAALGSVGGRSMGESVADALKAAPTVAKVPLEAGRDLASSAARRLSRFGRRQESTALGAGDQVEAEQRTNG